MPNYDKLVQRFMKRTKIIDGHWLWQGARNQKSGHGLVTIKRRLVYLHRFMFCLANGLDYDGEFYVCHKVECNIPRCWILDHLYQGDNSSNVKDTVTAGNHHEASKTHCPRGHRLWHTAKSGKRVCLECNRLRDRNRKRYTRNGQRFTVPGTRKI